MSATADTAVVAISYDPVETLARFAGTHGITYPLLSDTDSRVITRLGLLNTTIEGERQAYGKPMEARHQGLPYPGSFLLDTNGVIAQRRFERAHQLRPTAQTLLAPDAADRRRAAVSAEASAPGVTVAAWTESTQVSANQIQAVHVAIQVDPGLHVYTEPIPDGFTALRVSMGGDDRLRVRPGILPQGTPLTVEGLPDTFSVLDGRIEIQSEVYLHTLENTAGTPARPVTLTVDVGYQACSDTVCYPPESVRLELDLREEPNPA